MIIVIIAGGSGTRLWPLSTPEYPKHLLKINGDTQSLLQQTYQRASRLSDQIYVVSEAGHVDHVKEQLSELSDDSFIVEPARRGTSSCIIAALAHITKHNNGDEPIAILSADHYVRDIGGFVHSFKVAAETSKQYGQIVLVGIEPDYPATGFGYIQKDDLLEEKTFVFKVHSFKEKPEYELAREYMRSGNYLWNCGYFVGSVSTFVKAMKADAPVLYDNYEKLLQAPPEDYESTYLSFENISIDYALIEKVKNLLVVPASFDWMDLGSFGDLHKAVGSNESGNNHLQGIVEAEGVSNSFVQNQTDTPLAVIGLDNVVVVQTSEGVLVARKDLAQKVGPVSKRLAEQQKETEA